MQNVHLSPPELAPLFGVNVSTIKRWVDKGFIQSVKTSGGHRRISREQLAAFVQRYPKYVHNSYVLSRLLKNKQTRLKDWQKYYRHLHQNEVRQAEQQVQQLYLANVPMVTILDEVIAPALRHIGDEWFSGRVSVFEEHRMSFIVRVQLLKLDQLVPDRTTNKSPHAILACAAGDHHELPLLMVGLVLKRNGWRTTNLGINITAPEMDKACRLLRPQLICLTKTYSQGQDASKYLAHLKPMIKKIKAHLIIGGGGWPVSVQKKPRDSWCRQVSDLKKLDEYLKKN
ncbi:MAG: cobalamin-dependent protein [Patescibacteria group bacterium]